MTTKKPHQHPTVRLWHSPEITVSAKQRKYIVDLPAIRVSGLRQWLSRATLRQVDMAVGQGVLTLLSPDGTAHLVTPLSRVPSHDDEGADSRLTSRAKYLEMTVGWRAQVEFFDDEPARPDEHDDKPRQSRPWSEFPGEVRLVLILALPGAA